MKNYYFVFVFFFLPFSSFIFFNRGLRLNPCAGAASAVGETCPFLLLLPFAPFFFPFVAAAAAAAAALGACCRLFGLGCCTAGAGAVRLLDELACDSARVCVLDRVVERVLLAGCSSRVASSAERFWLLVEVCEVVERPVL